MIGTTVEEPPRSVGKGGDRRTTEVREPPTVSPSGRAVICVPLGRGAAHGQSVGKGGDRRTTEVEVAAHGQSVGKGGDLRTTEVEVAAHGQSVGKGGDRRTIEVEGAAHGQSVGKGGDLRTTEVEVAAIFGHDVLRGLESQKIFMIFSNTKPHPVCPLWL